MAVNTVVLPINIWKIHIISYPKCRTRVGTLDGFKMFTEISEVSNTAIDREWLAEQTINLHC